MSDDAFAELDALIQRLDETPILSNSDASKLYRSFSRNVGATMIETGQSWGQASGDHEMYNQSEEAFRDQLKATDNNLNYQISVFTHGLDRWFQGGVTHPPYFPWRIAMILSKQKELKREKRFLASYCRHFWDRNGNRDQMIVARAEKKGAFDRFNRQPSQ